MAEYTVGTTRFNVSGPQGFEASFNSPLAGAHNLSNTLSMVSLAYELGLDPDTIQKTLTSFRGVCRRQEVRGEHVGAIGRQTPEQEDCRDRGGNHGGDGSDGEVVNGIVPPARERGETVRLGFLPLGTGNAFLRSFATEDLVGYAIGSLISRRRRPCDVLVLHHAAGEHYLINLLGLGMSVETSIRSVKHKRWGGIVGFLVAFAIGSSVRRRMSRAKPPRLHDGE